MADKPSLKKALVIQFVSKYANVVVQLVLTAVLARLLTPEEYGLIAIVTVFTSFFSLLADMGLGPAIVQFRDLNERDLSGLFTFSALLGIILAVLFCLLSFPISWFYGDGRLVQLCMLASIATFFSALNMVPNGMMLKKKRFASIGVRLVVTTLLAGIVAITMALAGFGAYSLIGQSVTLATGIFVWNFASARIRVGNIHFMNPLRKVASYSAYQFGFSFVNYFSRNLDNLLIGRVFGASALGYYDKAYKLTGYPVSYLPGIVGSTLQSFLAEHQNDFDYIYKQWVKVVKLLSLVGAFVAVVFFCCSEEIIVLFYGDQWEPAMPVLRVLSISLYFQIVNNAVGSVLQSTNHTDYLFRHSLISTGLTVTGLFVGLAAGDILYATAGVSTAYCLHTVSIIYFLIHKTFKKKALPYLKLFVPEAVCALFAAASCCIAASVLSENLIVSLVEKVALILLVYGVGCLAMGQKKYLSPLTRKKKEQ